MTTDPTAAAMNEGATAFATGQPVTACPYSKAQGSPTRLRAIAWVKGYRRAQSDAEIAEQETSGHFRDR